MKNEKNGEKKLIASNWKEYYQQSGVKARENNLSPLPKPALNQFMPEISLTCTISIYVTFEDYL